MRVVQHFDQAVFQFEALVQLLAQLLQLAVQALAFAAVTVVAAVIEVQRGGGDRFQTRVDLLGQFKATLVAEGLRFACQLFVDFEMTCRHVVEQ
ncbi:hypothetical protein FQZ97_937080 [compost metagenome]